MPEFSSWSLWLAAGVFAAAAGVVWWAGTRLAGAAGIIAERTGAGQALIGMLLLGGITSLPEVAVTLTSSLAGNAPLAVNNLLGGVAMQVAILGVADVAIGRPALSSIVARPVVLLQGVLGIVLLAIVAIAIAVGDVRLGPVGAWTAAIGVSFVLALWLVNRARRRPAWRPAADAESRAPAAAGTGGEEDGGIAPIVARVAVVAVVVFVGGYVLSRTGEVIAERTGLGSSFVGAILLAISTSLPEVSTVVAAARAGRAELAFGDIFGTNLFDIALLFVVDVAYRGGPVLSEVSRFSQVAALLGALVTAIYVAGLIERRNWSVARMGPDSIAALLVYLGGLALLYTLR